MENNSFCKKREEKTIGVFKIPLQKAFLAALIMVFSFISNFHVFAQDAQITLKLTDVSLKEALASIEKQTSYSFVYNSKILDLSKNVSADFTQKSVSEILDNLFKGTDISYVLVNNQIVLSSKTINQAPPKKVKGTVKDEQGEAMIGAAVRVGGSTISTITDANGNFEFEIPGDSKTLVFTFVGYLQTEVQLGNESVFNIGMKPDVTSLNEVIVVGYGSMKKKDLTGSVVSVNSKELSSLPVPSVGDALQGRASGVQVISSGTPGNDATFVIRGASSINSDSKPLLVIDGIPTFGGLNQLNPDDIESIQVLKDASASAIYGTRGSNGVIIITTKRGKGDKAQVSLNAYYAWQKPTNMIEMLNASEYAAYSNEMLENGGRPTNPAWTDPTSLGKGTDWLGELFSTAPMKNVSLSYSGSSENSNIYSSVNFLDQDGVVLNTNYKRYTIQFNSDNKIAKFLKFGNNLTLTHDIKSRGDYNIKNTMGSLPTQTVRNEDGTFTNQLPNPEWYGGIDNPIGKAVLNNNTVKGYNLIGSLFTEVDIIEGLRFKSNLGLQLNIWDDRNWNPKHEWVALPQTMSSLSHFYNKSFTWLWDNTLSFSRLINDVHSINLMAGTSAQENRFEYVGGFRQGFITDETPVLDAGSEVGIKSNGGGNEWSLFSYFGRANYTYAEKYLLTGTIRRDGSSKFGPSNRYGVFPSASLAWRISKESFFADNISFINDFKIRGGYGETGNQEMNSNYPYATLLSLGNYNFNNEYVQMAYPLKMPNYQIHWESVRMYNLGFDASLIDNRVEVAFDVFDKKSYGMLVRGIVIITTGYDNQQEGNRPFVNAGEMRNRGLEFNITTKNIVKKNFSWNTNINFSYLQNKILDLNDTVPITTGSIDGNINLAAARHMNGHPYNSFFGYVSDGVFQNQDEVDNAAIHVAGATQPGDMRFKDLNYDGIVDDKDRTFIGNPNPDYTFSMNNTFAFYGFDLSIFIQGVYGNEIFNANRLQIEGMDAARNQSRAILNRWKGEGTSNTMPRAVFGDPSRNNRISDRYIEDGSYVRLKNLTLGYTIPAKFTNRVKISNLKIYFSAQNLYTMTNYSGIDPEVGISGIDNNVYPVTTTYSAGFNMNF